MNKPMMESLPPGVTPSNDTLRRKYEEFERRRQVFLLYLFNTVSFVFLSVFGVAAIMTERWVLTGVTLGLDVISISNLLILRLTGKSDIPRVTFVFGLVTLFTYLLASGGVDLTGPLWAYPIMMATITLQGLRRGLPLVAL